MQSNPKKAHDLAEEGVDAVEKGQGPKGEGLIDRAQRIDPQAIEVVEQETDERRRP